ncbi:MAG: tryptophan synthase subunit alpha [Acidimicrobiia bacterium]|nr:tryptophan synthase subunit alpha [Acidimicrobiia bacterium]
MAVLESTLRARRDAGRKLLVPYVTAMMDDEWLDLARAFADAGADAIEIGIPFSDPIMDGVTIQETSLRALQRGATPPRILEGLAGADVGVPLVAMTYYNLAFHAGHERFAGDLAAAGVDGTILADLQLDECAEWAAAAERAGIENVLLAAPTSSDDRLARICEATRGFVYAISLVGVTGERRALAATATVITARLKALTDKPVLAGIGISTPEQAAEACATADGVVMASALLRQRLDGATVGEVAGYLGEVRRMLDAG